MTCWRHFPPSCPTIITGDLRTFVGCLANFSETMFITYILHSFMYMLHCSRYFSSETEKKNCWSSPRYPKICTCEKAAIRIKNYWIRYKLGKRGKSKYLFFRVELLSRSRVCFWVFFLDNFLLLNLSNKSLEETTVISVLWKKHQFIKSIDAIRKFSILVCKHK